MRHTSCTFSPARALRQIFLSSSNPTNKHAAAAFITTAPLLLRQRAIPTKHTTSSSSSSSSTTILFTLGIRTLTTTAPLQLQKHRQDSRDNRRGGTGKLKQRLTDGQIPYKWVRVVQEDGSLSEPQRTTDVLLEMDKSIYFLEMVAPPPEERQQDAEEAEGEADPVDQPPPPPPPQILTGPPAAICRIVDREAAAKAAYGAMKAARQKAVNTKELELNWAIAAHDLAHKARRLRGFLAKGMQVEVLLAKKRHGRAATPEEAAALLRAVRDAAAAVRGARETKKPDGEVGKVLKVFFEGPSQKMRRLAAEAAARRAQRREEGGEVEEEEEEEEWERKEEEEEEEQGEGERVEK